MSPQAVVSERLEVSPEALATFCRRWHIARLEVFGSVLREDFGTESDIDFLVSFEPDQGPLGLERFRLEEELAQIVGRKVDVVDRQVVEKSRNLYRRHHILREATPVHGS
jgi:predicted nucleotidyltransferase